MRSNKPIYLVYETDGNVINVPIPKSKFLKYSIRKDDSYYLVFFLDGENNSFPVFEIFDKKLFHLIEEIIERKEYVKMDLPDQYYSIGNKVLENVVLTKYSCKYIPNSTSKWVQDIKRSENFPNL